MEGMELIEHCGMGKMLVFAFISLCLFGAGMALVGWLMFKN